jgi:hypothetical protein
MYYFETLNKPVLIPKVTVTQLIVDQNGTEIRMIQENERTFES